MDYRASVEVLGNPTDLDWVAFTGLAYNIQLQGKATHLDWLSFKVIIGLA